MLRRFVLLAASILLLIALAAADNLTTATINDPTLNNMKAFTVNIPAGWKLQGTVMMGPKCDMTPFPLFRAYSPDGLSEMRLQPAVAWSFHPAMGNFRQVEGCLPYQKTMTAAEFLNHYMETISGGMHIVGPMPIAAAYHQRIENMVNNLNAGVRQPGFHATADEAAVRIETHNGSFVIEQRLRAWVECRTNTGMGKVNGGGCSAHVDVLRAPKGKLDALVALVDSHDLTKPISDSQWVQAMLARQQKILAGYMANLTAQEQRGQQMLRAQHEQIMQTMERNHQAFMQQQETSFEHSQKAAFDSMNARSTVASDWVDYALDQKTVFGSNGTAKVSTDWDHVWSDGHNNWFLAQDPNANPNGSLPGNWSEDVKVHGNGQPIR